MKKSHPSQAIDCMPSHQSIVIPCTASDAVANLCCYLKAQEAPAIVNKYGHDQQIQFYLYLAFVERWLESLTQNGPV
jgi:hypothetical protein